jgi:hypothetical protein
VTLSLLGSAALVAALLLLMVTVMLEELGVPDCVRCLEPSRHPWHSACTYRRCQGGHHSYEPRRVASNIALVLVALAFVVCLVIAAAG